jgi:DNA-binding transcriptional LysR family regulator
MSDFDQVVAFDRVVLEGSFTGAARSLGLGKSTVSERVSALEARLGVQLLARTTRTMRLTDDGAAYHARARQALGALREAEDALKDRGGEPRGLLRVTAPRLFGHAFLGEVVSAYLARWPDASAQLMLTERKVDLVEEGFDVAIRIGVLPDSSLRQRKLGSASMVHVASPGYLKRRGVPSGPGDLGEHDLILVAERPGLRWPFVGPDGPTVYEGSERLLANSLVMAREAAAAGTGIAWVPGFLVAEAVEAGELRIILGDHAAPPLPICALTPGGRFLAPKVRAFLDLLAAHVGEAAPWSG